MTNGGYSSDAITSAPRVPSRVRRAAITAVVAMTGTLAFVGAGSSVHADPPFVPVATVPLGLVQTFGVLGPAAIGNAAPDPATVIRGDMGAGGAVTGFPPGQYTGTLYQGAAEAPAMADLQEAYDDAKNRPAGAALAADVGGTTAGPGVHTAAAASGMAAAGVFTIDGDGHPDAVFIFQINGALALGANTQMLLINGAQAKNVFWQVNGAGTIGAASGFVGTLIATTAVSSGAGSTINGRLTSLTGAITMSSTQLYSSPPSMSITGEPAAYTTTSTPVISGVTSARSPQTVSLSIDGVTQTPAMTPSSTGDWSFQAGALINGAHTIVASSVDGAGNVGSATLVLTVDTTLPEVTIDGGPTAVTNDLTPRIAGTTDIVAGQVLTLTFTRTTPAASITRTTLVQTDSTWNLAPNGLSAGEWIVVATVIDPAGNHNTATQTLSIDITAPVVTITSSALTNDPTPSLSGFAEAGSTVTVAVDGAGITPVAHPAGTWSTTFAGTPLVDGPHNVTVSATDLAGNTAVTAQVLMVDTVDPAITILPGPTATTNDLTPTIIGTTDVAAGATVSVSIDAAVAMTTLVQAGGSWNVTPGTPLAAGVRSVVASIADPAGNIGSFTQVLVLDVTAAGVIINGGPSRSTADATPTISGSSTGAAAGAPVTVTVAGQTLITTVTVTGTWSVTAATISNGAHVVFVTIVGTSGTAGDANQSLTINAVAPTVTINGGATASTNDDTPVVSGTSNAPAGSAVTVDVAGQMLPGFVQPGGTWNVTAAHIANSTVTVTVSVIDSFGNVGTAAQLLTIDSTSQTPVFIDGGVSRSTNDATPTISGTTAAADGRSMTVTVAGQTLPATTAGGLWSVNAAHLGDGVHTVNVTLSSVGGNPGAATQQLIVDTVAPVVAPSGGGSVTTDDSTPPISGSGMTPGSTVTVTVAGQTMTTTVAADGTWSVTLVNPLPAGSATATITITDPAGNTGTATQTITVTQSTTATQPSTGNGPAAGSVEFISVGPKRVFDTRPGQSPEAIRSVPKSPIGGAVELRVQMTDLPGFVPASGVGAVSLNVTSNGATADGYITVYACGTREVVSSVNFAAGHTVANAVITPVSASGAVCFYANTATDVIVDINGWFATGAAFTAVGPKRVFDTRPGSGSVVLRAVPAAQIASGGMLEVQLTDLPGFVPAVGVAAVSLNVVVTNPGGAGFITVYACGARAVVSSVNYVAGQTVANAVIAPVSANGTVCFYSLQATDLVVDINGWLATGSEFNAIDPARILDTRPGQSPDAIRDVAEVKIGGTHILEVQVTDLPGRVPAAGVSAVSLNVTATNPDGAGYITVYSCGTREVVSSVNFDVGATVANAVLAPVSERGTICLFANVTTDVIVDVNGWIGHSQP
jgi:Ice-binding-like/Bacterial Ig-like domain